MCCLKGQCQVILSDHFGMVKWPFQRLSDLQLGDKKVTLNHLVVSFFVMFQRLVRCFFLFGWSEPVLRDSQGGGWLSTYYFQQIFSTNAPLKKTSIEPGNGTWKMEVFWANPIKMVDFPCAIFVYRSVIWAHLRLAEHSLNSSFELIVIWSWDFTYVNQRCGATTARQDAHITH